MNESLGSKEVGLHPILPNLGILSLMVVPNTTFVASFCIYLDILLENSFF